MMDRNPLAFIKDIDTFREDSELNILIFYTANDLCCENNSIKVFKCMNASSYAIEKDCLFSSQTSQ